MSCNGGSPAVAKMRMVNSCNGCRALRKGCSDHCIIRPCLEWITTPEAQGNATVFLAKFYGRAGLLNLIAAAPADARPAVFRSLIYEACGRIVNPVYGAVGLLWSGQWQRCVDAVDAMFKGELGVPVDDAAVQADAAASSEADAAPPSPPPQLGARLGPSAAAYDIRHFDKDSDAAAARAAAAELLRLARAGRGCKGFMRAGSSSSSSGNASLLKGKGKVGRGKAKAKGMARLFIKGKSSNDVRASPSPPLGQAQQQDPVEPVPMVIELFGHDGGREEEFAVSHDHRHLKLKGSTENTGVEAAASRVSQDKAVPPVGTQVLAPDQEAEEEVGLELTLGFGPVGKQPRSSSGDQTGSSRLRLQLPPA